LCNIFGRSRGDQRNSPFTNVIGDRQQFESRKRTKNHIDLITLDQFHQFGLGAGRIASGVGSQQFDLAANERIALFFQEGTDTLAHLISALGERTSFDGKQADFYRA